jgi:hypothetical protein
MHHSTLITLMFLMFGQLLILSFGVFVLWLTGDFGGAPKLFNDNHPADQTGETTIAMQQETGEQSNENSDGLMPLALDHSIQPQAAEEINALENDVEHPRDRAVRAFSGKRLPGT